VPEAAAFLIVEDNEEDVVLLKRAFEKCGLANPIQVVKNGVEAMAYLAGGGRYRNRAEFPLPKLILLDLKLPGIDGFEVLEWIRKQPEFSSIRVVVLTSSTLMSDVNKAYQLGANSFLVKPTDFDDLVSLTRAIRGYWIWIDQGAKISDDFARRPARG
jgi:CheY-like chemotaxis protein